ncbi:MAG: ThiF family adenylyltransferase, partial [Actinomycetota bacterium]|nr:ThiF family adenylyltransferase [Actinomycetota bacterium]
MSTDTLPRRPRLRPGLALLHRRTGEIQIGLDPRHATVVSDLPGPVVDAAGTLSGGRTTDELLDRVGPRHRAAMHTLLTSLAGQGYVEDAAAPEVPLPRRLAADMTAAALRRATTPAARTDFGVAIHGDGRIAVSVACLLASAGIGRIHVQARGEVTAEDVGTGLTPDDIGRSRQEAVHDAVRRIDDEIGTQRFTRRLPDLVVLTDALVPDPSVVARLSLNDVSHLMVRVRDGVGLVGP